MKYDSILISVFQYHFSTFFGSKANGDNILVRLTSDMVHCLLLTAFGNARIPTTVCF